MTNDETKASVAPEVSLPAPKTTAEILRRTSGYLQRYSGMALANIGFALISLLFSLVFPQVTQFIIDDVIGRAKLHFLVPAILALLAAYFFRDAFDGLRIHFSARFEQNVIYDMRRDIYGRLQRLPLPFFDGHASGDLMSLVMEDVIAVERVVIDGCEIGVTAVLSILAVVAILFVKDAALAAYATIPLLFLAVGTLLYTRMGHVLFRMQRQASATMNALIADNLQGIRQIKAFGQEQEQSERFRFFADALRRRSIAVMSLWAVYSPAMNFVTSLGTVLVMWQGGKLVVSGDLSLGQLVGFLFYLPLLYQPIGRLHRLNQMLQAARASIERLCDALDEPDERISPPPSGKFIQPVRGEVRYEKVSFAYAPGRPVLRDISLHAKPGEMVALVGRTGSGKSSLASLLLAFYRPLAGQIEVDGQNIQGIPIDALRAEISIVSQEAFLFNGTVRDNILFARAFATEEEMHAACRAANCHEFIMQLPEAYESRVGERGVRLSVGEKQRISIARALLKNSPILVLDEATASVDFVTEGLIQEALQRLMKGRTTFVIAHRLATVQHADQILVMEQGAIVERGRHEDLIERSALYRKLCNNSEDGELFC